MVLIPCTTAMATRCCSRGILWASLVVGRKCKAIENIMEPLGEIHTLPLRPGGGGGQNKLDNKSVLSLVLFTTEQVTYYLHY